MKVIFRISVLLNLVLLGFLMVAWFKHPGPVGLPATVAPAASPQVMAAPKPARAEPGPFRWSQLGAGDYHVYVKNLRAVGCPERAVQAIVAADVGAVYDQRRRGLEQKLAALEGDSWSNRLSSTNGELAIQAELQQLPAERTATINDLLGLPPSRGATLPAALPVTLPLALQTFDLAALNLDAGQVQAMQDLRQRFLDQMGGTPPDPNDAAAMVHWQQAQAESDDLMAGFLGSEAYQNMQLQALANRESETSTPP